MTRRWTLQEEQWLTRMVYLRQAKISAIAAKLGRTPKAIQQRIAKLRADGQLPASATAYFPGEPYVPCVICGEEFFRSRGPGLGDWRKYCSKECATRGQRVDPQRDYTICPRCKEQPRGLRPDGRMRGWCRKCESAQKTEYQRTEAGKATWRRYYYKRTGRASSPGGGPA